MAERPAKRQRTSITHGLSESESKQKSPSKQHGRSSNSSHEDGHNSTVTRKRMPNANTTASVRTTPEKSRKTVDRKPELPTKSLHNFFSRATDEQRWRKKSATPEPDPSYPNSLNDDIIDDEDDSLSHFSSQQSDAARDATDRARRRSITPSSTASSTQKRFVRPGKLTSVATKSALSRSITHSTGEPVNDKASNDHKPWADRFGPETLEELAVHKKKVADVQQWLDNVLAGRERQRLLVLKGPAGSGKTTTISLIAQARNARTISWQNPVVSDTGSSSVIQQFSDFLHRGGDFEALDMNEVLVPNEKEASSQNKIMLIEEFPLVMAHSSKSLNDFRSTLLAYLAASDQNRMARGSLATTLTYPPVVIIISETLLSSSTALTDSFTAHRLLGTELLNHPLVSVIEFNPVATTFISKALDLVIRKEARVSARRRIPGPAVISSLAEIGDIRSAINSLEFLCARGSENADWSGTVAGRVKKKEAAPLTQMEKDTLRLVSLRESTLDMFHATGKIVYNKREDPKVHDTRADPPPKPPDHLMRFYTPHVSQVDIDTLLGETGTDIQTFISTLHENYVLSCNGETFSDSFDECAHALSDSDILNPDSRGLLRSSKGNMRAQQINFQSGNSEMLRQDEISFNTACRGLLLSLPYPVHRAIPPNVRKQDAFKMFYPASLRIWKPAEEIHDLIAAFRRHGFGSTKSSSLHDSLLGEEGGVASWRSRGLNFTNTSDASVVNSDTTIDVDKGPSTRHIISSEDTSVLEVLPYATKIFGATITTDSAVLKKITQFRGSHHLSASTDIPDEQEEPQIEIVRPLSSLSAKVEAAHNSIMMFHRQRQQQSHLNGQPTNNTAPVRGMNSGNQAGRINGQLHPTEVDTGVMERLYISDDDIVDD